MGPPCGIDPTTHRTMSGRSTTELDFDTVLMNADFLVSVEWFMGYPGAGDLTHLAWLWTSFS